MKGFIFDYSGTLDVLADPVQFLRAVREKYPEHKIILYTGSTRENMGRIHPGLEQLADHWICKPDYLKEAFGKLGLDFKELTYFDYEAHMRKAAERSFKGLCKTGTALDFDKLI